MASVWIEVEGKRMKVDFGPNESVSLDNVVTTADLQELEPGVLSLRWTEADGRASSFRCVATDGAVLIDGERVAYAIHDPRSLRATGSAASASGPKALKAPMPGRIVRVLVDDGESVTLGQGCIVIEAMKMQNELKAPRAGIVRRLQVQAGETVAAGATLLIVE